MIAQARSVQPGGPGTGLSDKSTKDYAVYKTYLLFFGLIDAIYKYFFKVSNCSQRWGWFDSSCINQHYRILVLTNCPHFFSLEVVYSNLIVRIGRRRWFRKMADKPRRLHTTQWWGVNKEFGEVVGVLRWRTRTVHIFWRILRRSW